MDYQRYREQKHNVHAWFAAKDKLIERLLVSVYGRPGQSNRSIIDIGCGAGTELPRLEKFGRVIALDGSSAALEIVKKRGYETIRADIENYPLPAAAYDCVCCFDLLEHTKKDELVMKNIFSALKSGGYFIFTVPAGKWLFGPHDLAVGHQRRYGRGEIISKLRRQRWQIIRLGHWNTLLFPLAAAQRIGEKIRVKFGGAVKKGTVATPPRPWLNRLLYIILSAETLAITKKINLPWGLTIYGIAQKRNQ